MWEGPLSPRLENDGQIRKHPERDHHFSRRKRAQSDRLGKEQCRTTRDLCRTGAPVNYPTGHFARDDHAGKAGQQGLFLRLSVQVFRARIIRNQADKSPQAGQQNVQALCWYGQVQHGHGDVHRNQDIESCWQSPFHRALHSQLETPFWSGCKYNVLAQSNAKRKTDEALRQPEQNASLLIRSTQSQRHLDRKHHQPRRQTGNHLHRDILR